MPARAGASYSAAMAASSRSASLLVLAFVAAPAVPCTVAWSLAAPLPRAFVDGDGPGWQALTLADFQNVNGDADVHHAAHGRGSQPRVPGDRH